MTGEKHRHQSMRKYLKENHPTFQKVQKLFNLADDLKIQIVFNSYCVTVTDNETGKSFYIRDLEDDGTHSCASVNSIPHFFEHKLVTIED